MAASSQAITTGALVLATTSTIASLLPPKQNGATGATCNPCYYMDSSDAAGNYTINVRSSAAPYHVYGWYTTYPGGVPSISKSTMYTVTVSTPGQIGAQNLAW